MYLICCPIPCLIQVPKLFQSCRNRRSGREMNVHVDITKQLLVGDLLVSKAMTYCCMCVASKGQTGLKGNILTYQNN